MSPRTNATRRPEMDASEQQKGSQDGVSVLSRISLNKKMQAVAKLGQRVQQDVRLLHEREQAAQVVNAREEVGAMETAMAQAGAAVERAQADCTQEDARLADEERGYIEMINTRTNKALRRCEAERAAVAESLAKSLAAANAT